MNPLPHLKSFYKINIYLASPRPTSREKDLIKYIIQNYNLFNTQFAKIKLGKIFNGVTDLKQHELFCERIKLSTKKNELNIILIFGNHYKKNEKIGFVNKLVFKNKRFSLNLPYADMIKEIKKEDIEPYFISRLNPVENDFLKKLSKYFNYSQKVISSCIFFPSINKNAIYNEKIYNVLKKWISLYENEFLINIQQDNNISNKTEDDPSGGW